MKLIIDAFQKGRSVRKIIGVKYSDKNKGELCSYYPDKHPDINFEDFLGKTRSEAMAICEYKYHLI